MKGILRKLAIVMAMIMVVTSVNVPEEAKAASVPKLNVTKKTITGKGKTYKLVVKNQKAGCKYTWSTSNKKIATVAAVKGKKGSANVKALKAGTATISCKITYPSGIKRILKAKITVKIPAKVVKVPATGIKISNAKLENNVQIITLGQTYDFKTTLTPSNSTDQTFFTVVPADAGTFSDTGVFTPAKAYDTVNIYATAAATKEAAATSTIKDMINVKIVEKSASITGVAMNGADEIQITFSMPVNPATVVDRATKQLTSAVIIAPAKDSKGNQGADFGNLTSEVSADGLKLLIKSSKTFSGSYSIVVTSDVKAQDGTTFDKYTNIVSLVDTQPPVYVGTTVDDSGLKASLNFNEALDVSGMSIADVKCNSGSLTEFEKAVLSKATNYVLSKDEKSLVIDLTSLSGNYISTSRAFTIQIQGIKDLAGNMSSTNFITATVIIDTTTKAQAVVLNVTRTSYEVLTVEYSRAIQPGLVGTVKINNSVIYTGTVDSENNKLVHYPIPAECVALKGPQTVSIQGWHAYNASSSDTSSNNPVTRVVDFSADSSVPAIVSAKLLTTGGQYSLILEYSKQVTVEVPKGTLSARVTTASEDIYDGNLIGYAATVSDKIVTLVLDSKQMSIAGRYEFKIPEAFAKDSFYNKSAKADISVVATASTDSKLPAPTAVEQSKTDKNIITITFQNKLDQTSAENVANYVISGVSVLKAKVTTNTKDLAIVELTINPGGIPYTSNYRVTINGVKGFKDSYNPIEDYQITIALTENAVPQFCYATLSNGNRIVLTFSEAVTGKASFNVMKDGSLIASSENIYASYETSANTVTLLIPYTLSSASGVTLIPNADNRLVDADGNVVPFSSTIYVR